MKFINRLLFLLLFFLTSVSTFARVDAILISTKDPLCFGSTDGYMTINSLITTAPSGNYSIRINTSPVQFFNVGDTIPLGDGNYTITLIDQLDGNAVTFKSFSINEPFDLVTVGLATNASCFNVCDGAVTVLAFDGTAPYTYIWDDPGTSTTSSVSGLCDGMYHVTVTDFNGCVKTDSAEVFEPDNIVPNVTVTQVACFGESTGIAVSNPTGGSGTYTTFNWSTTSGNTTNTEINLAAGNYTVTVTDNTGCTNTETFVITEPASALTASLTPGAVLCFGESTGTINTSRSGGTSPYTFAWNDGPTSRNRTGIPAGTYTITVTDNNGCTVEKSTVVTQRPALTTTMSKTDITCFGDNDGTASVVIGGGTAPYGVSNWSNGATGNSITGLAPNRYYVTITDLFGCTKLDSADVLEPAALTPSFTNETNPSCIGASDGSITATATGGTPAYTFNWSNGVNNSATINGLPIGSYTVTVIDANGCTNTLTSTLVNPPAIVPTISVTDALCNGSCTGELTANPLNGTGPYTYSWSSGGTAQTESSLCTGTYTVTVTDNTGCTGTESAFVDEPLSALDVVLTPSSVLCFGKSTGSINTVPSGGTAPYTYLWNDGPTSQNRLNIPQGNYQVTVTDFNGCTKTANTTVTQRPIITASFSVDDVSCNGLNDGEIRLTPGGGTPNYSPINWSNGGSGTTISNLTAGRYYVTITDLFGCTLVDSADVDEPDPLIPSFDSQTEPLCNGDLNGTISISVIGGTPAYTYLWSDGNINEDRTGLGAGNYTVTVTDAQGCTNSISTTLTNPTVVTAIIDSTRDESCPGTNDGYARVLPGGGTGAYTFLWSNGITTNENDNLPTGTYNVTVTDNNGCTATTSALVGAPAALVAGAIATDASCNGVNDGTATANQVGGTSPYTYTWGPGNPTGQGTTSISGLSGGTYTVTITDANGCTDEASAVVNQPSAIGIVMSKNDALCFGQNTGDATATPSGGNPGYTYLWSDPLSQTTPTATNLIAGNYTVTVSDNNGCTNSASITINEPSVLGATISASVDPTCNGVNDGTATVTPSGGDGNYTYLWSDPLSQTTPTATNLSAGTFTVTVTDGNGCSDTDQIILTNPASVAITLDTLANVLCFGGNNGYIGVIPNGGTPPYTYNWSNGGSTDINQNLVQGTYDLTVTDNSGCFITDSYTITEPTLLSVSINVDKQPCFGSSNGELTALPSGGTSPYTFLWSNLQTTATITGLANGFYMVTVSDDNGCTATASTLLNPLPPLTVFGANATDVSCFGGNDGNGIVLAVGTNPLTYSWSDGGNGFLRTNLIAGNYVITITDGNGCFSTIPLVVNQPALLVPNITTTDASCAGVSNGTASSTPTGGTSPFTFNWSTGVTNTGLTDAINGLASGSYTLTVTDANSCDSIETFIINQSVVSYTYTDTVSNMSCFGVCDGFIEIRNLSGGTAPFTYNWSNGISSATNPNLCAGTYTVTMNDAVGCDSIATYVITEPTLLTASVTATDESCGIGGDGTATGVGNGGTSPYTFNWSTGASGNPLTNLTAGNYDVTVVDGNGCTTVENFTVNPAPSLIANETENDPSCFGACDGDIVLSPSGGIAPYTFLWDDNSTNFFRNSLCDGSYDVTITDNIGCSTTENFILTEPSQILANLVLVDESCGVGGDGSATASPTGGAGNYTFAWSNGTSANPLTGLSAGNYDVTITDGDGCFIIEPFTINPAALILANETTTPPSCFGLCDGDIILSPSGGTAPYTFLWDDNSTNFFRNTLCDGSYDVTITDNIGCSLTQNFILTEPTQIIANLVLVDESCGIGNDGSATASPTGGAGNYTFAWSTGTSVNPLTGLTAGNYDVTITDGDGCFIVEPFTINSGSNILANETTNDPSCFGACDGDIVLSPSGGTAPYTFLWDDNSTNFFRNTLCDGSYDVTITDNTGCTTTQNFILTEPSQIVANLVLVDESCGLGNDGSATASPTGGAGNYTFAWSNGTSANPLTGLSAGNYDVTITDGDGCFIIEPFTINPAALILANETTTPPSCFGLCDGDIILSPSGGTAPYTFLWDDNSTNFFRNTLCDGSYDVTITDNIGCSLTQNFILTEPTQIIANLVLVDESCGVGSDGSATASPTGGAGNYTFAWSTGTSVNPLTGLSAGNYDVTITDGDGCFIIEPFTINSGSNILANEATNDPSCFGACDGDIILSPSGGIAPYTFLWDDNSSNFFRNNLCDGSYDVTITDNTGCTSTKNFILTEPSQIVANLVLVDESCGVGGDGSATASPTGGAGNYTFAWSTGTSVNPLTGLSAGNYDVTITDGDGCFIVEPFTINPAAVILANETTTNPSCFGICDGDIILSPSGGIAPYTFLWDDNSTNFFRNALCDGSYDVTITDNSGCTLTQNFILIEPTQIVANLVVIDESCGLSNGSATASPTGGAGNYTFAWSTGTSVNPIIALSAGNYDVTITDGDGCFIIEPFVVNVSSTISANETTNDPSCFGLCDGDITLSPSGGTAPYTFLWDDNSTNFFRNALCDGSYDVTITDNTGCTLTQNFILTEPTQIQANLALVDESCGLGNDGSATASPSGGAGNYTFAWSTGTSVNPLTGLSAGNYDVTITDGDGCFIVEPFTINSGSNILANETTNDPSCFGLCDGDIILSPSGGTAPYTFLWDNNSTNFFRNALCDGSYDVTITDNTGCTSTKNFILTEPTQILANLVIVDESCGIGGDGSATASPTGGAGNYTFAWSTGTSVNPLTGLTAGNYDVTITDGDGCFIVEPFTINSGSNILANETTNDPSCFGLCDGDIILSPSGGTAPYTFLWDDNSSNFFRNSLCDGSYDVTITDNTGCTSTKNFILTEPTQIQANLALVDESCGLSNGSATASPTGGAGNYTFAWSNGTSANPLLGLSGGNYDVTITDGDGCFIIEPFVVNISSTILANETENDPSCFGLCDGDISLSPSGGTAPYTFLWDDNSTNFFRNALCDGSYDVTITDNSGCTLTQNFILTEPTQIVANLVVVDESCGVGGDGSATASPTGGAGNYTFAWSTGTSVNPLTGLTAGNYDVTITDGNGCFIVEPFTINSGSNILANETTNDPSCFGVCDGDITLSPSGGVAPYTFLWDDNSSNFFRNALCDGSYDVTITDNTGCSSTQNFILTEPSQILANLVLVDESCGTGNDGSATASPTGGAGNYTFAWSNGTSANPLTGLTAGNYDVTITDGDGCFIVEPFIINTGSNILANEIENNPSCFGICDGDITLSPSGGTAPYTFLWDDNSTNSSRNSLCDGSYDVTITDNTGCSSTKNFILTEPSQILANLVAVDESCGLGGNGSASASPSGGAGNYTFAWSTGTAGNTLTNLSAGNYDVTITDKDGCFIIEPFIINPYPAILPNESSTNETCSGLCDGAAGVNPTGGIGTYTFAWNTGAISRNITNLCGGSYTVTITDGAGCDTSLTFIINSANAIAGNLTLIDQSCTNLSVCDGKAFSTTSGGTAPYTYAWSPGTLDGQGTDTIRSLCVGTYFLTITDAVGCTFDTTFNINGPQPISASFAVINSTCNICNGEIVVTASGGSSSSYTYNWLDASLNPLGVTTDNIDQLCSGVYFVDISDGTGCSGRFSVPVNDIGAEAVTVSKTDVTCFNQCDGQATASFVCLDPNCSVEWFNGTTGVSLGVTTATASNLCAGDYFVEVVNNSGCKTTELITINQPSQLAILETITESNCFGSCTGAISLLTTGGSGSYSYNWSPGPGAGQGTSTISGLCVGTYFVTITDGNLCDSVLSFVVNGPSEISASFSTVDANCGQADGFVSATVTGGIVAFDYSYQWFDGANNPLLGQTSSSLNNISAGSYRLFVTDDNGCAKSFNISIGNIDGPILTVDSTRNNSCFNDNNGKIFITVSGSNGPFTYNWSPFGQTSEDLSNLSNGTYTVIVRDALGCISTGTSSITSPSILQASIGKISATCGLCNGQAGVTVTGGTAPYTYLWSNGSTSDSASALCGGSYSLVVSDANACSQNFNFAINTIGGPTGETVTVTPATCATSCNGTASVTPIGGTAPYTFTWIHNGATTNSLSNLCPGNYLLQYADAKGCSRTVSIDIDSPVELLIAETVTSMTCNAFPCDGSINLNVTGGTGPYTYLWNPNQNDTNFVGGLCAGVYGVTVSDANGCSKSKTMLLNNSGTPVSATPTVTDLTCSGVCTGSLISNVTVSTSTIFQWLDNQGTAIAPVSSDLINAVCAGDYILEVTTLPEGCKSYERVTVDSPDSIKLASSIVKNISCNGACDGEIFISTIGGNILYSYSWNDPSNQDGIPAKDLCAGTYGVTATDASGCSASTSVTLVDPPALIISILSSTDLLCSSDCNASANVIGSGGSAPYTYTWSGGQTGTSPTDLCFGPNVITLSDITGCSVSDTVFVGASDTVVAVVPPNPIVCDGNAIHLLGSSLGSTVNQIAWYEGTPSNFFTSNLDTTIFRGQGSHPFYLIASNGSCSDTSLYDALVTPNPIVGLAPSIRIFKDEIAAIKLSGKDDSYRYLWKPAIDLSDSTIAEPLASPRQNRIYTLVVTDTNGCEFIDSIKVIYQPDIKVPSGITPNGDGTNDTWNIDILEDFPNASVYIYNRWGELLYEQINGYKVPWDGTYKGDALPIGTYYFVIDFHNPRIDPLTGPITIVK